MAMNEYSHALRVFLRQAKMAIATGLLLAAALTVPVYGADPSFKVIFRFDGSDGSEPPAELIRDNEENLYGMTVYGGPYNQGEIFKLHQGQLTVLYNFGQNGTGQGYPITSLVRDKAGNLYGFELNEVHIFKLDPSGNYTELVNTESGNMTLGPDGNLYGPTYQSIFKLNPKTGKFTVLYTFPGQSDPNGDLVVLPGGNIYGTTRQGGDHGGRGTVYKLSKSGKVTTLHEFTGGTDGLFPFAGVIRDEAGNLYGTTAGGGDLKCGGGAEPGCGTVFKLDAGGNFTVLYSFKGKPDGAYPGARLALDSAGDLYGTSEEGGSEFCRADREHGCGTVFKIDANGKETLLHSFKGGDGLFPVAGLLLNPKGNLYGVTADGNHGFGLIFKITQ